MVRLSPGFAHVALSMSAVQLLHAVRVAVFMLCLPFLAVAGILVATVPFYGSVGSSSRGCAVLKVCKN